MSNSVDKAITALANRQRGYATTQRLLDLGLGPEVNYRSEFRTIRITWQRLREDPAKAPDRLRAILSARRD